MAVDAVDDVDLYSIPDFDSVEKSHSLVSIQPGMVEFADAVSVFFRSNELNPEGNLKEVVDKLYDAIQRDSNKAAYHILRAVFSQALGLNEMALVDMTQAIEIATTREAEWLLGTKEFSEHFQTIETTPSGHPQYDVFFRIELDLGELYWMRYDIYCDLDREGEPAAINDLRMAAELGNEDAIDELDWLGIPR